MKFGLMMAVDLRQSAGTDIQNSLVPLGLGFIAESIARSLPDIEIVIKTSIVEMIVEKPDIIGISSVTDYYYIAVEWAIQIKQKLNIPVIIGGIHISLLPHSMNDCFDAAVIGEGEITILELLQSIIDNKGLDFERLREIQGLFFYENGKPILTPPRPLIENLDLMPMIRREHLPFYNPSSTHVFTARGCPYRCRFCSSSRLFEGYRSHSTSRIVHEIEVLVKEKGVTEIVFFDDLLIASKKRLVDIVDGLDRKGILGKCTFTCQVRANLVDVETCVLLKRLGIRAVGMGIESFSDKVLDYYNKQNVTAEVNQKALDLLSLHLIEVYPSFIFGAPIETIEDTLVTLKMIYRNFTDKKIHGGGWGLLRPFPGTEVWDEAERIGVVSTNMDWVVFNDMSMRKLYFNKLTPYDTLLEIINEWRVKFTLAFEYISSRPHDKSVERGPYRSLLINDTLNFYHLLDYEIERLSTRMELVEGDELVIDAKGRKERGQIIQIDGIWPNEDQKMSWLSRRAEILVYTARKGGFSCEIVIPDLLFKYAVPPVNVEFQINGNAVQIVSCSSSGIYPVQIPLNKNDKVIIKIVCDKWFVPKDCGINDDGRELSVFIRNLHAE